MALPFPYVKPTSRTYIPGRYPQKEFVALNGAVTRLIYGNRRSGAELRLEFANITDAKAAEILENYEQVTSVNTDVTITASNAAIGASSDLVAYLRETGGSALKWRYAEPPSVTSVLPGISTVSVVLTGTLDAD